MRGSAWLDLNGGHKGAGELGIIMMILSSVGEMVNYRTLYTVPSYTFSGVIAGASWGQSRGNHGTRNMEFFDALVSFGMAWVIGKLTSDFSEIESSSWSNIPKGLIYTGLAISVGLLLTQACFASAAQRNAATPAIHRTPGR